MLEVAVGVFGDEEIVGCLLAWGSVGVVEGAVGAGVVEEDGGLGTFGRGFVGERVVLQVRGERGQGRAWQMVRVERLVRMGTVNEVLVRKCMVWATGAASGVGKVV